MKKHIFLSVGCLILFLSVGGFSQKAGTAPTIETIDGIEYVHNAETPLYPNKTVKFEEELSIGEYDQDGNVVLFQPFLSLVDDQGQIYISDYQDQDIKIFNPDGKLIITVGAKGQGPGEFNHIGYVGKSEKGELIVHDSYSGRMSFFDSSGRFLKSFKKKINNYQIILLKTSSFITCVSVIGEDRLKRTFDVQEIDLDGNIVRYFEGNFRYPQSVILRSGDRYTYFGAPVTVSSLFKGDPFRNIFYHCVNDQYSIDVYDDGGKLFRKIDRPYKPVLFTKKDAQEYRERYTTSSNPEHIRKAVKNMEMPKVKNVVERLYLDDESRLWIKLNETKKDGDRTLIAYDVFNPDGHYFAKIWTDKRPYIFVKGKMFTMIEDPETGFRTIKRYKVVWN